MMRRDVLGIPVWVWLAAFVLASAEPLTHFWIQHAPPGDAVPTGLHTGDSHVYLHAMRMVETDCYSPYASCHAEAGMHSCSYYSLPVHWLYGALGAIDALFSLDHFIMLGIYNGLCGAFYLLCVFVLLRTVAPKLAGLAFALFLLGGGPGGVLYLISHMAGWHDAAGFDDVFQRFAIYELIEGAYLWPVQHLPRLYYTLPLGLSFLAFALAAAENGRRSRMVLACLLLVLATGLNMRVGAMMWAMMAVYLMCRPGVGLLPSIRMAVGLLVPVAAGIAFTVLVSRGHPTYAANQFASIRETVLLSPLLSAALFHWLLIPRQVGRSLSRLPALLRTAGWAAVGYLAAFAALYAGYQLYYGTYLQWIDVTSAIVISDWALLGAIPGAIFGWRYTSKAPAEPHNDTVAWAVVWVLIAVSIGVSAWGQGWFMQFLPRRLLVVLGLPLALVSAAVIYGIWAKRPRLAGGLLAVYCVSGLISVAVAVLSFQGPLGRRPGEGPFAYRHYELMTPADAGMMDAMAPGRVLAPLYTPFSFTEVIGLREGMSLVCGVGTLNHSDQLVDVLKADVDYFFSIDATASERAAFLAAWCADYVYCPDTCSVSSEVRQELENLPFLELIDARGRGAVFAVKPERF